MTTIPSVRPESVRIIDNDLCAAKEMTELSRQRGLKVHHDEERLPLSLAVPIWVCLAALAWAPVIWLVSAVE